MVFFLAKVVYFYNSAYTKYMKVYAQCAVGVGASQIGRVHDLIKIILISLADPRANRAPLAEGQLGRPL